MTEQLVNAEIEELSPEFEAMSRPTRRSRSAKRTRREKAITLSIQLVIVAAFLLFWEYAPKIDAVSNSVRFLNPFYISSPSRIVIEFGKIATGSNGSVLVWPYLGQTLEAFAIGTALGVILGGFFGLILSNYVGLYRTLKPFILLLNAVPRIALIPVIIIITGPTVASSITSAVIVVTFVIFFNALEGGRSVPAATLQNARLLGAGNAAIMLKVRLPNVLAWTFAALPNAVSFGIVSVLTAEILTGTYGLGQLLTTSLSLAYADLTFAVVIITAVVALICVGVTEQIKHRYLHWWEAEGGN